MCAIRGSGFGIGAGSLYGPRFGAAFGVMAALSQVVAYRIGIRPTLDYQAAARPRLTIRQQLAALNRTVGYTVGAYLSALVAGRSALGWATSVRFGLVIGLMTAIVNLCSPFIEWSVDRAPAKRLGVFGIILILTGFSLQSVQYFVTLLDVDLRS
jgi:hypothetical protein